MRELVYIRFMKLYLVCVENSTEFRTDLPTVLSALKFVYLITMSQNYEQNPLQNQQTDR